MACLRFVPSRSRRALTASAAFTALLLAGCAQQKEAGYYAPQRESTLTDAQHQAQRQGARAPSQIQLGFGEEALKERERQAKAEANAQAAQEQGTDAKREDIRPLREPKTFLGTIPCLTGDSCPAARVTLTLAPNGQWRSRTQELGASAHTATQGCWDIIGSQPWRIVLRSQQTAAASSFTFVNDNVLRVDAYNGVRPTLEYRLTRQPDVDGIDELNTAPAPQCEDRS